MNLPQLVERWFSPAKHYCSFCGKHHSSVAKLIAGRGCSICNECALICSTVLMKQCEEYRKAQLEMDRKFLVAASKSEPNTTGDTSNNRT